MFSWNEIFFYRKVTKSSGKWIQSAFSAASTADIAHKLFDFTWSLYESMVNA